MTGKIQSGSGPGSNLLAGKRMVLEGASDRKSLKISCRDPMSFGS